MIFSLTCRVNYLSKATDDFAKSVLSGVISTVGIIPNAIIRSSVGRAILKTAPGEVALASMISFCECLYFYYFKCHF